MTPTLPPDSAVPPRAANRSRLRLRPRVLVVGVALCGLLLISLRVGAARESDAPRTDLPESVLPVVTLSVEPQNSYTTRARYAGRVLSRRTSLLGFTSGGRLDAVAVEAGHAVEAGQVLARLDTAAIEAQQVEIEAQAAELRARLELAELSLGRTSTLAGNDSVSQQRHDEARIEAQALTARLAATQAAADRIAIQRDRMTLRAPYAGHIRARHADEGTILAPGEPLLELLEVSAMEARIGVPPATADTLQIGDAHTLDIEGRRYSASISAVLESVASRTRTVTIIFDILANESQRLPRDGALAHLSLATELAVPGFWLPITALSESQSGLWAAYALIPEKAGEPHGEVFRVDRRQLQLIHTEADRAYLRGTLRGGERVVASGAHRLVPGQRVQRASTPTEQVQH